jgi:hypothetical protein
MPKDRMANELNQIAVIVKSVMEADPKTRADDRLLVFKVWQLEYFKKYGTFRGEIPLSLDVLRNLSSPDSISRIRRKLQECGFCRPDPKDAEVHENKRRQYRQWAKSDYLFR